MSLLPVSEAQARLLALRAPLPIKRVPLAEAFGLHAAEAIVALRDQPAAHLSAMDGYAIRFAELPGPWMVVGESAAGRGLDRALAPGEAARIFTGAPLPQGADTILIQEEAARDGVTLSLADEGPPRAGWSVRRRGSDFATGAILVEPGMPLTPRAHRARRDRRSRPRRGSPPPMCRDPLHWRRARAPRRTRRGGDAAWLERRDAGGDARRLAGDGA